MTGFRPLRFALFALELPRLALVLVAVSGYQAGAPASHAAAFAAPHSLFALLALFSWLEPERREALRPVFAAGKLVSAAALIAWLAGAVPGSFGSVRVAEAGSIAALIAASAVAAFDLLEGILLSVSALRRRGTAESDRDLPELVVDELPEDDGGGR